MDTKVCSSVTLPEDTECRVEGFRNMLLVIGQ